MRAAIYTTTDGAISRRFTGPADAVDIQCGEGEEFFLNCPEGATHIINNEPVTAPPTEKQIITALTVAIQQHLDSTARTRHYDSVDSASKYIGGSNPTWNAEGLALRDWTIAVWEQCYEIMAEVQAGNRGIPTAEELLAELPVMSWP
jgi:hypothetical protein